MTITPEQLKELRRLQKALAELDAPDEAAGDAQDDIEADTKEKGP